MDTKQFCSIRQQVHLTDLTAMDTAKFCSIRHQVHITDLTAMDTTQLCTIGPKVHLTDLTAMDITQFCSIRQQVFLVHQAVTLLDSHGHHTVLLHQAAGPPGSPTCLLAWQPWTPHSSAQSGSRSIWLLTAMDTTQFCSIKQQVHLAHLPVSWLDGHGHHTVLL